MTLTVETPVTPPGLLPRLIADDDWPALLAALDNEGAKEQALAERDYMLWGLLHLAVSRNPPVSVVAKLLDIGFDINDRQSPISRIPTRSPIFSVFGIPVEQHTRLINAACDPRLQLDIGATPLIAAILYRAKIDVIKLLLERGADVTLTNLSGETPLLLACERYRNLELIELLVSKGSDAKQLTFNNLTCLHELLYEDGDDIEATEREGTANNEDGESQESTDEANDDDARKVMYKKTVPRLLAIAKILIASGTDINAVDIHGWSPLCFACDDTRDTLEMVQLLVEAGADINNSAPQGIRPAYLAAGNGNMNSLKYLLDGVSLSTTHGKLQATLLLGASGRAASFEVVKLLVERGANVNERDNTDATALFWLCGMPFLSEEALKIAEFLIQQGADVNTRSSRGATPLLEIIGKHGEIEDRGMREAPQQKAKRMDLDLKLFRLLLDHGAVIDVCHGDDDTPLICCAAQYADNVMSSNLMDLILDKTNPEWLNRPNGKGLTPLEAAAFLANDFKLVEKIKARGALVTPRLKERLEKAKDELHKEIATYLEVQPLADGGSLTNLEQGVPKGTDTPETDSTVNAPTPTVPTADPPAATSAVLPEATSAAVDDKNASDQSEQGVAESPASQDAEVVAAVEEPKANLPQTAPAEPTPLTVVVSSVNKPRTGLVRSVFQGLSRVFFGRRRQRTNVGQ